VTLSLGARGTQARGRPPRLLVNVRWFDAEGMSLEEAQAGARAGRRRARSRRFGSRGWEGKILACRVAASARSRTSASASGCTSRSPSTRGTWSGSRARTRPRWTRDAVPGDRPAAPSRRRSRTSAARCASALRRSSWPTERSALAAYNELVVHERHRHRYEVNNHFRPQLVEAGPRRLGHVPGGAGSSRSSSCRTNRGSSRASSTRSSSRGPTAPGAAVPRVRRRCVRPAHASGVAPAVRTSRAG
jgi:CTP synthase